jgi:hypothetical protein
MKHALVAIGLWLSCVGASPAAPKLAGTWQGSFLLVRFTIQVEQQDAEVFGKALVIPWLGRTCTYHVSGRIDGDRVVGRHHQGHSFAGKIEAEDQVSGVLTTRRGFKVHLTIRRKP